MKEIPTSVENQNKKSSNIGLIGFLMSLTGLMVGWVPLIGLLIIILSMIFSILGLSEKPRGLTITGLCISITSGAIYTFMFILLITTDGVY